MRNLPFNPSIKCNPNLSEEEIKRILGNNVVKYQARGQLFDTYYVVDDVKDGIVRGHMVTFSGLGNEHVAITEIVEHESTFVRNCGRIYLPTS